MIKEIKMKNITIKFIFSAMIIVIISGTALAECQLISFEGASHVSCLHNGLARVKMNGKFGFIDQDKKIVIPIKYDYLSSYFTWNTNFVDGLARAKLDSKWGFINQQNQQAIPIKYDHVGYFDSGKDDLAVVTLNGKKGFVNKQGKVVIPIKYKEAHEFTEGLASVKLSWKYGYINSSGEVIVPIKYDDASRYYHKEVAHVRLSDKWMVIDKLGKAVVANVGENN